VNDPSRWRNHAPVAQGGQPGPAVVKSAPFEYHAPETVDEVVDLLGRFGDDAKVIAGGQSLVPLMALRLARFDHLVDLNRIPDLRCVVADGGALSIGAMAVQATLERDPVVVRTAPLLPRAIRHIGHFQIRSRGTLGGACAHADPAAELPALTVTLDAEFEVIGPRGERRLPAAEFFESTFTTALAADEIVSGVHVPAWPGPRGFAIREFARRHGDFALAGALCAVTLDAARRVSRAAIGLLALDSRPRRATAAEKSLLGLRPDEVDATELGRLAVADVDPPEDVHAGRDYRRRIGAALVAEAVTAALEEAGDD
jgi:aerobic carbon-monoxide dehydrogenase medium subunit